MSDFAGAPQIRVAATGEKRRTFIRGKKWFGVIGDESLRPAILMEMAESEVGFRVGRVR